MDYWQHKSFARRIFESVTFKANFREKLHTCSIEVHSSIVLTNVFKTMGQWEIFSNPGKDKLSNILSRVDLVHLGT